MIIDENFRIVKDTYDLDRGKTMVSQEVIDSYNGKWNNSAAMIPRAVILR